MDPTSLQNDTTKLPLISVVIPCYNFGHLIGYSLDSLLAQSYTNWECIIVDDGSSDNSEEVIARYIAKDKRFTYHKQVNSGPAKARNVGIELATGDWLQFLDADDLLSPEKLKYQVEAIVADASIDVVYGPTLHFTTTKNEPGELGALKPDAGKRPSISGQGKEVVKTFLQVTFFPSAGLIKRSVVDALGHLDVSLIQSEDWDLFLRAAQMGASFKYLGQTPNEAAALIRKHDSNNTGNFFRLAYYVVRMREKFNKNCDDAELLALNNSIMQKDLESLVIEVQCNLKRGERKQAIERSFKILELKLSVRYLVYALACMVLPVGWFVKLTEFSFGSLVKR